MCFGGDCGATVDLNVILDSGGQRPIEDRISHPDLVLFAETAGTFLVEVESPSVAKKLFAKVPYSIIGDTTAQQEISILSGRNNICTLSVDRLKEAWQKPMKEIFH